MPKPLPTKNQPNSRRLWLGFLEAWALTGKSRPPDKYKAIGAKPRYGWVLPNTRRWRKIVRQALAQPRIMYDLIVDPGCAAMGHVFDEPSSYMYTQYGVTLAWPSGRFGESQPNWQDLPLRRGRLIGTAGG